MLGDSGIRVSIIGVLAMLAIFLLAETISTAQALATPTKAPADTVTVSGTGEAALPPDIAYVTFTVQNQAANVATAQDATTKQANAAIAYVKQQGVADKDVSTLSYNITPQYKSAACPVGAYCPVSNEISGYQVSESIRVTVRDLSKVSPLLSGLGQQNVQNISGPEFGLANPNEGPDAARAKAIENAKTEAQTLAAQLDVRLGRIVSFSENTTPYRTFSAVGMGVSASAVAPQPELPAGQNTYTANVSITYAIR